MIRIEQDALGQLSLPGELPYGIQTYRAVQNFAISGRTIADIPYYVSSIATIKKAAALANGRIGALSKSAMRSIAAAADEIILHQQRHAFPVDIYQGGGGTSSNMNVNEVIALRANILTSSSGEHDPIHPNNHVNMGQSTNDVVPSALKMAVHCALGPLIEVLGEFLALVQAQESRYFNTVKLARTCLQDALPLTFGQQLGGYRSALERIQSQLEAIREGCLTLPLGATAVGTGLGSFPGYKEHVYGALHELTGKTFVPDQNFFDALQNADAWLTLSAALKALALTLSKFASDLRLMSSGPRGGLAEVELPAVQPGSSIMPGKVNPVIPEMVIQVYFRVLGNDASVTRACEGELDLNVWESLIINCLSESISLLTNVLPLFGDKCVSGITANEDKMRSDASNSLAMSTVISTLFDYQTASVVAKRAAEKSISVQQASIEEGLVSEAQAKQLFDPLLLANPAYFDQNVNRKV